MSKIDSSGPAFPAGAIGIPGQHITSPASQGMSLRDYVAIKAFIFFLADEDSTYSHDARRAFHAADAFIAQRSEGSS